MLKKFLKFLGGDSGDPDELDESYLSHLLDEIQPKVVEQLEETPEHDPLLLVVAELLRETGGERFEDEIDGPLTDRQTEVDEKTRREAGTSAEFPEPPSPPDGEAGESEPEVPEPPSPPGSEPDESEPEVPEPPSPPGGESDESDAPDEEVPEPPSPPEAGTDEADEVEESDVVAESGEESAEEVGETDDTDTEEADEEAEADRDSSESESDADDEPGSDDEAEHEGDGTPDDESDESESDVGDEPGDGDSTDTGDETDDESTSVASDEGDGAEEEPESDAAESEDEEGESDESEGESDETQEFERSEVPGDTVEQVEGADSDELPAAGPESDATLDAEPKQAGESGTIGLAEDTDSGQPSLDDEIVLEMGRVFLGMMAENERLPLELQMGAQELEDARQLLQGYFLAEGDVEQQAQKMLQSVEQKFNDGHFSQAEILLRLFDSDRATRIENDRNLFYEEMILRFGIERKHTVGSDIRDELETRLDEFSDEPGELAELCRWISEMLFVTFDVYGRDVDEVEQWREIGEMSTRIGASERLLEVIPPRRWRLLDEFSSPVIELLDKQLSAEYVGRYVIEHVKTCYFVLRAVGDTGLEPYLDVFFDWVDEEFDVDGPALMPWIYEETTANERLIDDIFADVYRDNFEEQVEARRLDWDEDDLEEAVGDMLGRFGATDLDDVPPGHYDFGRFVLDELFDVEYPTDDFPYKMHRLV